MCASRSLAKLSAAVTLFIMACGQPQQPQPDPQLRLASSSTHVISEPRDPPASGPPANSPPLTLSEGCGFSAGGNGEPPGQCWITGWQADSQTTMYQIFQPVVNAPTTDYPQITLRPGDVVTVSATGCVQTGGHGSTWKRYVNPAPWQNLYYGTVTIPGGIITIPGGTLADGTPVPRDAPVSMINNQAVRIPSLPSTDSACVDQSSRLHLQLGYMDDYLPDDGYWGHDDGNYDQCSYANGGYPATVTIQIKHEVPGPYPNGLAYDLVPNCLDYNYFFMNPRWGWQKPPNPVPVPVDVDHLATGQFTSEDTPSTLKQFLSILSAPIGWLKGPDHMPLCGVSRGHRNWFDVMHTGHVTWDDHDGAFPKGDDDYNMSLWTNQVGVSPFAEGGMVDPERQKRIEMEFDSDETIDEFTSGRSTWWNRFRGLVDQSNSAAASEVNGHFAIVVGLMGIDAVHNPNAGNEIHPVHALAIHLERIRVDTTHFKDRWALFARNWGNEGMCSSLDHYVLLNNLTLRIGPSLASNYMQYVVPASSTISRLNVGANFGNPPPVSYYAPLDDPKHPDLLLTFGLKNPEDHSWYAGDFDIQWTLTQPLPADAFPPVAVQVPTFGQPLPIAGGGATPPGGGAGEPPARVPPGTQPLLTAIIGTASTPTEPDAGGELAPIWNAMTPAQQADAMNLYEILNPRRPLPQVVSVDAVQVFTPPDRPQRVPEVREQLVPQWQIIRRAAQARALCAANGGQIPFVPDGCAGGAPITLLDTSGGASGKNGWIVTPLSVILTARDVSGAGVDHTEYGFDGVNYVRYTGPFIAPEGAITIYYRSQDHAGNLEPANQRSFKIDTRPPTSQATSVMNATNVTMTYSVADPMPGSGAAGLHTISLRGQPGGGFETRYTPVPAGTQGFNTLCTDIEYWGEDIAGNQQSPHQRTPDLVPPALTVQPDSLCMWPPNHARVRFRLGTDVVASATDNCDPSPKVTVVAVTSNEPPNVVGAGNTSGDVSFSANAFCLRRERSGTGTGRVYTVTIEAKDYAGNTTRKQVLVTVPHSPQPGCGVIGTEIPDGVACE